MPSTSITVRERNINVPKDNQVEAALDELHSIIRSMALLVPTSPVAPTKFNDTQNSPAVDSDIRNSYDELVDLLVEGGSLAERPNAPS